MITQSGARALTFVHAPCYVCDADWATPVAVGEDFEYRTSDDSFLAVRCENCGLVYLDPRPADDALALVHAPGERARTDARRRRDPLRDAVVRAIVRRRIRGWLAGLASGAPVVFVDGGDDGDDALRAAAFRAAGFANVASVRIVRGEHPCGSFAPASADAAIAFRALEKANRPLELLAALRRVVRPGGRLVIVTENTESFERRLFAGRHWGGYRFPRHPALFARRSLGSLAARDGLRVRATRTLGSPAGWTASLRNVLADYGAPRPLAAAVAPRSTAAAAIFGLLDAGLARLGCGALLCAVLERP